MNNNELLNEDLIKLNQNLETLDFSEIFEDENDILAANDFSNILAKLNFNIDLSVDIIDNIGDVYMIISASLPVFDREGYMIQINKRNKTLDVILDNDYSINIKNKEELKKEIEFLLRYAYSYKIYKD